MNIASAALVVATVAVNFGWQPSPEDPQAYEVLMQVEPELVGVMAEGTAVPIESHVPKEVSPIRNIRVVVGNEKLPRTTIAARQEAKPTTDRIVRGQEPIEHTANFQADTWGASSPNRRFDQRNATIGSSVPSSSTNNPWTVENAQQSLNNTGNSLRNSVNSSIDDVTNQFNQTGQDLYNKSKDAASDFGNQLQNSMGLGSQPAAPAAMSAAPTGRYAPAPPPVSTPTSPAAGNWTTINPALAPPRLTPPPLANGVRVASNPAAGSTNIGPAFPPPPTTSDSTQRSLLANSPQGAVRESDGNWDSVWGNGPPAPATIGNEDATGMIPVTPRMRTAATNSSQPLSPPPSNSSGPTAAPLDPRYQSVNSSPPASVSNAGADDWANFKQSQENVFNDPRMPAVSQQQPQAQQQQPMMASQQNGQQPPPANQPAIQTANTNPPPVTVSTEEVPWKPLLAVSLALAGSLGANFYLGMSYAEARHRYRTLVAKTTHAFEKKAGLAA